MYSTSNIIIIIIVFIRVIDMQIYDKKAIIHLTQLWTLNGQGKRESKNHARHLPIFNINGRFHVNRTAAKRTASYYVHIISSA